MEDEYNESKMEEEHREAKGKLARTQRESSNEVARQAARRDFELQKQREDIEKREQERIQILLDQAEAKYIELDQKSKEKLAKQNAVIEQQVQILMQLQKHAEQMQSSKLLADEEARAALRKQAEEAKNKLKKH